MTEINTENVFTKIENISENVYARLKKYLPFVARVCLLSSFIQDNLIIIYFWEQMTELLQADIEGCLVFAFIMCCFTARVVGCVMVLLQKRVILACVMLVVSSFLQLLTTRAIADGPAFIVSIAIYGGLFLIVAESKGEARVMFAGVPKLISNKPKDYLQLSGRCLVMLMFFNFFTLESDSLLLVLQDLIGFVIMVLVFIGYKTKFNVLAAMIYLNVINFYENNWWDTTLDNKLHRLYLRHKFIQGISVTGGLLMIVLYGPGGISVDKAKKTW